MDASTNEARAKRRGDLWRATWRTHFYAAIISFPVMAWFAVSGLVVLYQQPLKDLAHHHLMVTPVHGAPVSYDRQLKTAKAAFPDYSLLSVTPPSAAGRSTVFAMEGPRGNLDVYVDGYRNVVLGSTVAGAADLTDFARSYHGSLLPRSILVPMPALAGLLGSGPGIMHIELGEVLSEIFAGWGLVLAVSGLYLWFPRRRGGNAKARFIPRRGLRGRPRWRDLHAVVGWFLAVMLIFFVATGLPWSSFWGANWSAFASKVTPNHQVSFWEWSGPSSKLPKLGDVARDGTPVPWAGKNDVLPTSMPPSMPGMQMRGGSPAEQSTVNASGHIAKVASLDAVVAAGHDEGMVPGYTITPPSNSGTAGKHPHYGVWVLTNPWPSSLGQQKAVYLNEFTTLTLARSDASTWGFLQRATELGVQTHMGTQFGLADRIVLTLACLAVLWNIATATMMWNARRRRGTLGIPRRPADPRMQRVFGITALALAVVYPLWGCTFLLALVIDRFVVRRSARLRRAFGMDRGAISPDLDDEAGELLDA